MVTKCKGRDRMHKKLLIVTLPLISLLIIPFVVQGATITACTFDKDVYKQGEIGYIAVSIYNDKDNTIRVTELTATINYYYTDGNVYLQKFYTDATLPTEIQQGNSSTFHIYFRLPTNIASGYTKVDVKAITELWDLQAERWFASEHPTYQPTLCIESPYKDQLEEQQTINEQLEDQLEEQQMINTNTTNMMYLFVATSIIFAAVTMILFILNRRARLTTQSIV